MTGDARIDRLRAGNPAAADLATLLSTAVRIEPTLIRRVRLLLPDADIGAELDLWASDVLGSASPLALSLDPGCAERLRADLAGPAFDGLRERAAGLIEESHAGSHWSLRLEEEVNRLAVDGGADAGRRAEDLLYAAVGELRLRAAGAAGPAGGAEVEAIARWLLSALSRISGALAGTEAGMVAGLSAATHLDGRFAAAGSSTMDAWMPWLLATAGIDPRQVPVRFADGRLAVGSGSGSQVTVTVPDTDPMTLDVSWHDGNRGHHRRIAFRPGEPVSVAIPVDEVELETLTGDRYRLVLPRHGARSGMPVAGFNFSPVRARLRPCVGRDSLRDRVVDQLREPGGRVSLTGPPGTGKTVLLGAVLDRLDAEGFGAVQHFYGIEPTWDDPDLAGASLRAKLESMRKPLDPLPGVRRALVVTVGTFQDPTLKDLPASSQADALGEVLGDAAIGNFAVSRLADPTMATMLNALKEFLSARTDGISLIYLSTHVLRGGGQAYLAATDTNFHRLAFSAVPFEPVRRLAEESGDAVIMFDHVSVPDLAPIAIGRTAMLLSGGFRGLAEVLATGAADLDHDGTVTLGELHRFMELSVPDATLFAGESRPFEIARNPGFQRPIVVALDDEPERSSAVPEVARILAEIPSARMIVTSAQVREGTAVDTGDPDDLERVCHAMLDHHRAGLAMAFDRPRDSVPFAAELVAAAGQLPRRLAAIIDWVLDQPVGRARIADLPPPLADGYERVWNDLASAQQSILELVAVTRSPLTVAELTAMLPTVADAEPHSRPSAALMEAYLRRLVDDQLLHLDGPADAPEALVTLCHPLAVPATGTKAFAHALHVSAFPYQDPATVLPGQLADAAHHHARSGNSEMAGRLVRCGGWLDLRARTAGVDALVGDLAMLAPLHADAALIHRTVVGQVEHLRAQPESFADIVHGGLAGTGFTTDVFADWYRPALTVRAVHRPQPESPLWTVGGPVLAAAPWPGNAVVTVAAGIYSYVYDDGAAGPQNGPSLDETAPVTMALLGSEPVIAQRHVVWLGNRAVSVADADVTCLFAGDGEIAVGRSDGTAARLGRDGDRWAGRKLLGHRGAVTAIARSAGGLLTAGADGTVRVWSETGETRRVYSRHHAPITAIATLGDDEVLTADEKGRIRWWNVASGADAGVVGTHDGRVTALTVAVDGTVVTAGVDGTVRVWRLDLADDPPPRTVGAPVVALATSRAARVAAWTADGVLTVWDQSGTEVWSRHPDGILEPVRALAFTDYDEVVVAHAGGVAAFTTGTLLEVRPYGSGAYGAGTYGGPARPREPAHLGALALQSEAAAIVGTDDGSIIVDLASGHWESATSLAGVTSVVVTGRQGNFAAVDRDGNLHTATGTALDNLRRAVPGNEIQDRLWVHTVTGMLVEVTGLDPLTVGERRVPAGPDSTAFAASRLGDDWIAVGDRHGAVTVTRVNGGPETVVLRAGGGAVGALVFGRILADWLVVGSADGSVHRHVLDNRLLVGDVPPPRRLGRHRGPVTGLAVQSFANRPREDTSDDSDVLAVARDHAVSCGADGTVRLWDLTTDRPAGIIAGPRGFRAVDALGPTVTARDDEGRLWWLHADPPDRPALRFDVRALTPIIDGETASVELEFRTPVTVDLLAVHLIGPVRARPRLELRNRHLPVAADGSLHVPRRLRAGTGHRLRVTQELSSPPDAGDLVLRLSFGVPGTTEARTADFALSRYPHLDPGAAS